MANIREEKKGGMIISFSFTVVCLERSTLEFWGKWEILYNPAFKVVEFDHFEIEAGLHTFTLSAKEWIEKTNALGMYVQSG